ncbi:hypothetical protein ACFV20_25290 [Streptomyces sp. NPDC059696]|uniref:hypothetical protein n=1 Tax=Streptomyces sp. NPDC059696 TaxID=3346911 RepID=UPI0036BD7EF0
MSGREYPSAVEAPWATAFERLAEHCLTCPTCTATDDQAANLRLTCPEAVRLSRECRDAGRGA